MKHSLLALYMGLSPLFRPVFTLDQSVSLVCTPQFCQNGTNSLAAGATVNDVTLLKLLPGTYSTNNNTLSTLAGPFTLPTLSSASAAPGFTISRSGDSFVVNQTESFISYTDSLFRGTASLSNVSLGHVRSFLLAEGLQMSLREPSVTVYDSSPDITEWSSTSSSGNFEVLSLESTACARGCGVGGTCSPDGTCLCSPGFTGARCDTCAAGFYGPKCQPCPQCSSQTRCEDGISGSGVCSAGTIGSISAPAALSNCNCVNGFCISKIGCLCSAGWVAASNGTLCAACAPGSFQDQSGNCRTCAPGCLSCASPTGVCDTCLPGLRVSSKHPETCEQAPFNLVGSSQPDQNTCQDGRYNANGTSCSPCSSTCNTCFGPSSNDCLQCSGSRGLLVVGITDKKDTQRGACVDVDSSTGVCHSVSGLFLYNSAKKMCEPAPRLCKVAAIPGFSFDGSNSPNPPACSVCETDALLLPNAPDGARCVGVCPTSTFDNGKGVCSSCPSSCATCALSDGKDPVCTSCADASQVLEGGKCVSTCKPGNFAKKLENDESFALKGTTACLTCGSSCATCVGNATSCSSCPSTRPAYDPTTQTCSSSCGRGSFVGKEGRCVGCDSSCASCSGGGPNNCLSCANGSILRGGKCTIAHCSDNQGFFAPWGICLETLFAKSRNDEQSSTQKFPIWLILVICVVALILVILSALITWRVMAVKKREAQTNKFGNEFYTRATDIKLKEMGSRRTSKSSRSTRFRQSSVASMSIGQPDNFNIRRVPTPSDRPFSTFSATSDAPVSLAPSSFKIKRKSIPSLLPAATDRGSIYSQPEEPPYLGPNVQIPLRSESGSVWFESGVRPPRRSSDQLDLDPDYHGPY